MKFNVYFSFVLCIIGATFSCSLDSTNKLEINLQSILDSSELVYPNNIMYFSQDFYLAIKYEEPVDAFVDTLSRLNLDRLNEDLDSYEEKLSFWINIYNSLVQYKLLLDSNSFKNMDDFFQSSNLVISGIPISLDEIEHGIIRGKNYSNSIVDTFKLNKLDYRIHFTMNCGASSCPAIAYYKPESLEQDLSDAENVFTVATSSYDSLNNLLKVSELFSWFKEDFKGEKGVIEIMKRNEVIPSDIDPAIEYVPYNWDLESKNYK
ncbi:MAG: hypothetical protein CL853_07205 [Crocinitomicaceae bacterium]|nr:hypothetical protein [Crocinitomicaceae bacterium]